MLRVESDPLAGAGPIAGIDQYCDRRCERCPLTARCAAYLEARHDASQDEPAWPARPVLRGTAGTRLEPDLGGPSPGDDDLDIRARTDPAVALARQYADMTEAIARALWPIAIAHGDREVVRALDDLDRLARVVASKTWRAVRGCLATAEAAPGLQSDANGSAKVARLVISASRLAWCVLMERGRATADGVPARLVRMLANIDAAILARFPDAMAFVRPGFDDDAMASDDDGGHTDWPGRSRSEQDA